MNPDDYTRVFDDTNATQAHLLALDGSPNLDDRAECGHTPAQGFWYGSGSQDEFDEARELRLCSLCKRLAAM